MQNAVEIIFAEPYHIWLVFSLINYKKNHKVSLVPFSRLWNLFQAQGENPTEPQHSAHSRVDVQLVEDHSNSAALFQEQARAPSIFQSPLMALLSNEQSQRKISFPLPSYVQHSEIFTVRKAVIK